MITTLSYASIKNNYEGKELSLVKQAEAIDWDIHPVFITPKEIATMDIKRVLKILQNTALPPSEMAGLKRDEILLPSIRMIDAEFERARREYRSALNQASERDFQTISGMSKHFTGMEKFAIAGTTVVSGSASAGIGVTIGVVGGPPGMALGLLVGGFIGVILGACGSYRGIDHVKRNNNAREASVYRISWLKEVDTLERKRYQKIAVEINKISIVLVKELKILEKSKETDISHLMKLTQLNKIFLALFPSERLNIEDIDVSNYLETMKEKLPIGCKPKLD